jgi:hypothetical protein
MFLLATDGFHGHGHFSIDHSGMVRIVIIIFTE